MTSEKKDDQKIATVRKKSQIKESVRGKPKRRINKNEKIEKISKKIMHKKERNRKGRNWGVFRIVEVNSVVNYNMDCMSEVEDIVEVNKEIN